MCHSKSVTCRLFHSDLACQQCTETTMGTLHAAQSALANAILFLEAPGCTIETVNSCERKGRFILTSWNLAISSEITFLTFFHGFHGMGWDFMGWDSNLSLAQLYRDCVSKHLGFVCCQGLRPSTPVKRYRVMGF